jgi:hypothetical protein
MRWKEDTGLELTLCSMMHISTDSILLAETVLSAFGTAKILRSHIRCPWNITQIGSMILFFAVEEKIVSGSKYQKTLPKHTLKLRKYILEVYIN